MSVVPICWPRSASRLTTLARQLYHSLHEQLLTLPDSTKVYPAHGAGSACGKNLSTETVSTIGEQRRTNYALAPMSEDDFVEAVTHGQSVAPALLRRSPPTATGKPTISSTTRPPWPA